LIDILPVCAGFVAESMHPASGTRWKNNIQPKINKFKILIFFVAKILNCDQNFRLLNEILIFDQ